MDHRPCKLTEYSHQPGDVDQNQNSRHSSGFKYCRNPAIGSEFKGCRDSHADEERPEKRAQERCFDHSGEGDSFLDSFCLREGFTQHQDAVNDSRDDDQGDLPLPVSDVKFVHRIGKKATDHDASGEPYMEMIELAGLLLRIERDHQGIARGFHGPIPQGQNKCSTEEHPEPGGKNHDQCACKVTEEGKAQEVLHSDRVAE
ncbi:MAG: hypothetical protein BWY82_01491 [Verrucomicrobia bacterium ADurb.Bin474]|nr:MAG: hypothetical protein BWY82_01491 [Verrucomicrobia bacterium ADurb.Bin474]